jgi:hypothetical protein
MNHKRWALTAVALFFGGVLVGYLVGHLPRLDPFQKQERIQQGQSGIKLGSWEAKFKPPVSVRLPDANPVVTFDFEKVERILFDNLTATITNMTANSYTLSYVVLGYDSKGRRISEDRDAFLIGGHESVVKKITLQTSGSEVRPASSFLLAARADQ